jgi:ABC-type multidrug transport system ATPase subunit
VFRGLSFAVDVVEIFAIAGRNGAGSTITMTILQRVRSLDGDDVALLGFHPARARGSRAVGSW